MSVTPKEPVSLPENQAPAEQRYSQFTLMSHDLRSALSDILGGLHLVDREKLDAKTGGHIDRVQVSAETLTRLLDKALSEDPFEIDFSENRKANVNLSDFLGDLDKRWSDRAHEVGISFQVESASSLPAIITLDRVSLDRILANLVGNAIKFTDVGRVVLKVDCPADNSLCFTIMDDGPGFSPKALSRLFEYAARPTDAIKPGSGMGLFIAKELADLIGGNLEIGNRDQQGARADLCLPYETWFDRKLRGNSKGRDAGIVEPVDLSGLQILLAEDNKTNQLVTTQMLRSMGAQIVVASDGLEALEMLKSERFDLALLDIEMPRMTGLELIRTVRQLSVDWSGMPLVALTAYVMRDHRERIYDAGADGIIAKPVMSILEFGQAILGYLENTKSRLSADLPSDEGAGNTPAESFIDREIFDNLVETIGPESIPELLGKLQDDTDAVAEGLGRGQQCLDLTEIRSQTHILISVAGAIGARHLQLIAQRLNAAANRQEATEIDKLCTLCLSGLRELQGFIMLEQTKVETKD